MLPKRKVALVSSLCRYGTRLQCLNTFGLSSQVVNNQCGANGSSPIYPRAIIFGNLKCLAAPHGHGGNFLILGILSIPTSRLL